MAKIRAKIRVAESTEENQIARERIAISCMTRDALTLDDDELLPLLMEPEMFIELSPLEQELVVRLQGVYGAMQNWFDESD